MKKNLKSTTNPEQIPELKIRFSAFFLFILYALPLILLSIHNVHAGKDSGGFPGSYLINFGVDARALGMGKAYTAIAYGPSGPYWNPAGLSQSAYREATFLFTRLFSGANYNFIGYAHPFKYGHIFGISRISLTIGDIEKTDSTGIIGSFRDLKSTYLLSYAYNELKKNLSIGINGKFVRQELDLYSDSGFGIDLGIFYKHRPNLSFGGTLQNIIPPRIKLINDTDIFPVNLRIGVAYKPSEEIPWKFFNKFQNKLLFSLDLELLNLFPKKNLYQNGKVSRPLKMHFGIECHPYKTLDLRFGIDSTEISTGLGIDTGSVIFNYAIGFHPLETNHRFSINVKFGMLLTLEEKLLIKLKEETRISRFYNDALKLYNEGKYLEAKDKLYEFLMKSPESEEGIDLLDKIEVKEKKLRARKRLEKAIFYFTKKENEKAQIEIEKANVLDSGAKSKLELEFFERAKFLTSIEEYLKSKNYLINVLFLNPEHEEAKELLRKLTGLLQIFE